MTQIINDAMEKDPPTEWKIIDVMKIRESVLTDKGEKGYRQKWFGDFRAGHVISSPEHKLLMVRYCDQCPSCIVRRQQFALKANSS